MLNRSLLVLSLSLFAWAPKALAQEPKPVKIIEPKNQSTPVRSATIDTEKFQAGVYFGLLAVEDFNSNSIMGLSFSYQINPNYLVMANYGRSEVGKATFERREGLNFLADKDREFSYLSVLGGYKLFTARSFLGARRKYDSDIYLLGGLGSMSFAGESNIGFTLGASYRVVFTDWLVVNLDLKDHFFKSKDVFGDDELKSTQNLEFVLGFNALF